MEKKLLQLFWRAISFLPDAPYVALKYFSLSGRFPNLRTPRLFTEKLQVTKIGDRNPVYPIMVDKHRAKDLIAGRVGREHVIETYWVGRDLDRVDWNKVPLPAVVKPTHVSGYGVFLQTRDDVDELLRANPARQWLAYRHHLVNREWAYSEVPPQIIIERMLSDDGAIPDDYGFLVYSGKVALIRLRVRCEDGVYECMFTPDWERIKTDGACYPDYPGHIARPDTLEKMVEVAQKVSGGVPFVRVDLYAIGSSVFVGELTLYPGGGFPGFVSDQLDAQLGQYWDAQAAGDEPSPRIASTVAMGAQ